MEILNKTENSGQKWKFWTKMEILDKNGNSKNILRVPFQNMDIRRILLKG